MKRKRQLGRTVQEVVIEAKEFMLNLEHQYPKYYKQLIKIMRS